MNSNLNLFPSPIVSYISFLNDFAWEPETISNQPNIFLTVPLSLTIFSPKTLYFLNLLMRSISSNLPRNTLDEERIQIDCVNLQVGENIWQLFIFKSYFTKLLEDTFFLFAKILK